jgi:HD-GYP domain-containing protein (c-di-GMP phosphodiesterase class II)
MSSDTQVILSKISALRQRLEQAQGLAHEAGAAAAGLARELSPGANPLQSLERAVAEGFDHGRLLDGALRQLDGSALPGTEARVPALLTARARRILERGRDFLDRLRSLANDAALTDAADPLAGLYRETAAMTETTLRMVQAFPDAPSAQLRLCEGLEGILGVIGQRLATLSVTIARRRREAGRVAALADLLTGLHAERALDIKPYLALAAALVEEASQSAPLQLLHAEPAEPARFIACHSLTVAQVVARVARHDTDQRGRPIEPVLAALVHDAGMLSVPVEILSHPGPLTDTQRRSVEGHARVSGSLAARLLPSGAWLAEAASGHHERLDGTGYPDGLRELQIGPLTRLLAVCDTYAALCTPRPHRPARETRTALADTLLLAEQGALDQHQAERLLQLAFYPVGSVVELADGSVGLVVATPVGRRDLNAPARPVLALLTDGQGQFLPVVQHLDLAQAESRSIVRLLPAAERRKLLGRRYPELA